MPCRVDEPMYSEDTIEALYTQINFIESCLCAIMSALDAIKEAKISVNVNSIEDIFEYIDWTEAGIKKEEILAWWIIHQKEDQERRVKEEQMLARERLISSAKQKIKNTLSQDEQEALGLSL